MARTVIIVAALCVTAFGVLLASNPLRRSEASISQWLEKKTPLGSSMSEVRATAMENGWYDAKTHQGSDMRTSGTYLRGELGSYQGMPWRTYVTVFWEFDEDDRLVLIRVWKDQDTL